MISRKIVIYLLYINNIIKKVIKLKEAMEELQKK